jgi:hypothetical protein
VRHERAASGLALVALPAATAAAAATVSSLSHAQNESAIRGLRCGCGHRGRVRHDRLVSIPMEFNEKRTEVRFKLSKIWIIKAQ